MEWWNFKSSLQLNVVGNVECVLLDTNGQLVSRWLLTWTWIHGIGNGEQEFVVIAGSSLGIQKELLCLLNLNVSETRYRLDKV